MEIEWPQKGDSLFLQEGGAYSACINWVHDHEKQSLYARSFERACIHLIDHVTETRSELDTFIYPIIFCFRHSLELTLKDIIRTGIRIDSDSEIENPPINHDLLQLWYLVKKVIIKFLPNEDKSVLAHVEQCIKEMDRLDRASMTFRYPEDKEGNPHLDGVKYIDTINLSKTMKALLNFFSGADAALGEVENYHNEMRRSYDG